MKLFQEMSNMKFGEAYNELASVVIEEGKDLVRAQKEQLPFQQSKTVLQEESDESKTDRVMFG